jgi:hypothetical protein
MTPQEELEQRLKNHKWWSFMSDDPSVDKKAQEDYMEIIQLMRDFPNREEAFELYKKHCPKTLFNDEVMLRKSIGL